MNAIERVLSQLPQSEIITQAELLEIFKRGPIEIQRDHENRVRKAKYLHGMLVGNQLEFAVVVWKGQRRLVDGYTRCEALARGLAWLPTHGSVRISTYAGIASRKVLMALYDQFNSPAAAKTTVCRNREGQRVTKMLGKLTSQLVQKAPSAAATYVTGLKDVRQSVIDCEMAYRFVDRLGLLKNGEQTPQMALYLAVAQYSDESELKTAEGFIRKLNQPTFSALGKPARDQRIERFRVEVTARIQAKTNTGGTNVHNILSQGLWAYANYLGKKNIRCAVEGLLTMGEFRLLMGR